MRRDSTVIRVPTLKTKIQSFVLSDIIALQAQFIPQFVQLERQRSKEVPKTWQTARTVRRVSTALKVVSPSLSVLKGIIVQWSSTLKLVPKKHTILTELSPRSRIVYHALQGISVTAPEYLIMWASHALKGIIARLLTLLHQLNAQLEPTTLISQW